MAINPLKLLKLKDRYKVFKAEHPKLLAFFKAASNEVVEEGSVLKIAIKNQEGKVLGTEITLTAEDIKTLEILKDIKG